VSPEDVAARFDNRPGYRVIDFGVVGLPVYKVTVIGLTLVKKSLDPIEEFVLRAMKAGLSRADEIGGVLGLTDRVISGVVTEMVARENVIVSGRAGKEQLLLTAKGTRVCSEQEEIKPAEQTLPFTFDGFLRRPRWYGDFQLYAPKELKGLAIPELRAFPDRGPELLELNVREVEEVVSLAAGRSDNTLTLLRITSIEKRVRLFKEGVALAYRAEDGDDIQIAFAIDSRLSESHERAFAEAKGLQRNPIFRELGRRSPHTELVEALDAGVMKILSNTEARRGRHEAAKARGKVVAAREEIRQTPDNDRNSGAEHSIQTAEEELKSVLQKHGLQEVRPVEVYEHAEFLEDALTNARVRLLIVSPWIRAGVVNPAFVRKVEVLLQRGVRVSIGYGLGLKDEDERPPDKKATEALHALELRYPGCVVRRLGDTHAKVLIKDRDYYVISSFNWLSFRGDRFRTFREELGTYVSIPERVDELYERLAARFTNN
jgi:hypothetical protein